MSRLLPILGILTQYNTFSNFCQVSHRDAANSEHPSNK